MKVFDNKEEWGSKVNFVDDNNVLVGYDMRQCCCEQADWFIKDTIHLDTDESSIEYDKASEELNGYNFDPTFFEESNDGFFDEGSMAIFKLTNETTNGVKYLHLFNVHNGYYSHNFTFENNNSEIIQEGTL